MGHPTLQYLPPTDAADCHHMVPVGNEHRKTGGAIQHLAILRSDAAQFADRGVLLKNDLSLVAHKNLQRVAFTNAHGPADLFGNYYSLASV